MENICNDSAYMKPVLKEVPWSDIICQQQRKPDGKDVLRCSQEIEQFGIKTLPLVNHRDGAYRLLTEENVYYAVQLLKWENVSCLVYEGLDDLGELRCFYSAKEKDKSSIYQTILDYRQLLRLLSGQAKKIGTIEVELSKIMHVCDRQIRKYALICNHLTENELKLMADKKLTLNQALAIAKNRSSKSQKLIDTRRSKR